jgi:hypothetical protein
MGISGTGHFLHFHSSLYNLDCYLRFVSEQPGPAGSGRQYMVYRIISGQCGGGYVGKVKEPRLRNEGLERNFSSFGGMTPNHHSSSSFLLPCFPTRQCGDIGCSVCQVW